MSDIKKYAVRCTEAGLSVVLTKETPGDGAPQRKVPALTGWTALQQERLTPGELAELWAGRSIRDGMKLTQEVAGYGIIGGAVSGGVECIDVDTKNDPSGSVWGDLLALIGMDELIGGYFNELYTERTPTGGYHIVYRYESPEGAKRAGNVNLARSRENKSIIETRGEGGYFVTAPTEGYEAIQGDLTDLPTLSRNERDRMIEICKSLCYIAPAGAQQEPEPVTHARGTHKQGTGAFDHYDRAATAETVRDLLIKHGWTPKGKDRDGRIKMLRPDNGTPSTAPHSGNILMYGPPGSDPLPLFSVFTTSALPFEPYRRDATGAETNEKRSYRPRDVYALLEHGGDYKAAGRVLYREGYGERYSTSEEVPTGQVTVSYVNPVTGVNIVICEPGGELRRADIKAAPSQEFTIAADAESPEVSQAIKLIQAAKRYAYVRIGDGQEIRDYRYLAQELLDRYAAIQESAGGLSDRDIDRLSADIVRTRFELRMIDRSAFVETILSTGVQEGTGITRESLDLAARELEEQLANEETVRALEAAMKKAADLAGKGKPIAAARELRDRAREIAADTFSLEGLLEPYGEDHLQQELSSQPEDVPSGFHFRPFGQKTFELMLPAKALSIIAARTGHRKTSMLMNMAVNLASNRAVNGDVYYMTYEETRGDLMLKMMNIHINAPLQDGGRSNMKYIKDYYAKGSPDNIFTNAHFQEGKRRYFEELINSGRLRIIDPRLTAPALCGLIEKIKEEGRPAAVFIDYIQQLRIQEYAQQSRQVQLQEICELLRSTATKTWLPLILGAQFNRNVKQEADIDSVHIREAGDIEQTANLVIGMWDRAQTRPGHEGRDGKKARYAENELYAEILKGRGVGTGASAVLQYDPGTWKIWNPTK
jgi:replicative DNA helicase